MKTLSFLIFICVHMYIHVYMYVCMYVLFFCICVYLLIRIDNIQIDVNDVISNLVRYFYIDAKLH